MRFWAASRSATELAANMGRRLTGSEADLLGYWPLDEGDGQSLTNLGGGATGTLGASSDVETADPDWSSEGPPL